MARTGFQVSECLVSSLKRLVAELTYVLSLNLVSLVRAVICTYVCGS